MNMQFFYIILLYLLSSYYPKNDHYEIQHTRVSKEPDNLTGGQKIHVLMIILHSILYGATGVIKIQGAIKSTRILRDVLYFLSPIQLEEYDAYTNTLLKFHSLAVVRIRSGTQLRTASLPQPRRACTRLGEAGIKIQIWVE